MPCSIFDYIVWFLLCIVWYLVVMLGFSCTLFDICLSFLVYHAHACCLVCVRQVSDVPCELFACIGWFTLRLVWHLLVFFGCRCALFGICLSCLVSSMPCLVFARLFWFLVCLARYVLVLFGLRFGMFDLCVSCMVFSVVF